MYRKTQTASLAGMLVITAWIPLHAVAGSFYDSGQSQAPPPATQTSTNTSSLANSFTRQAAPGWRLIASPALKNTQVRWPADAGQWLNGLDSVGQKHAIAFEINMPDKTVTARRKSQQNIPLPSTYGKSGASTSWTIVKGKSLRENIESWTKRAKWTLIWAAHVDYPVLANASFQSSDIQGAVQRLAQSIKHTQAPLAFKTSSNKVLRVSGGQEWKK